VPAITYSGSVRALTDDSGAGILEYGLVLSLVALLAIAALLMLGGDSSRSLSRSGNSFVTADPSLATP
jgi:Flp pilus assembly pilin Flp